MTPAPKVKLFYAILAYGGMVTVPYMAATLSLQEALQEAGIEVVISFVTGESLVQRGRNVLVHNFLLTDCTHLLFVDTDIHFEPKTIMNMIATGFDLVATPYPRKTFDKTSMAKAIERGMNPVEASDYVLNFATRPVNGVETISLEVSKGCVRVHDAPTGCMLVHRSVFVRMAEAYPEIAYISDATNQGGATMFAFFDCFIDADKRYLSEDYAFCRRWQKMGGEAWCQLDSGLIHYGQHGYKGNLELLLDYGQSEPQFVEPEAENLDAASQRRVAMHSFQYRWAAQRLKGSKVALLGCGTNWGASIIGAPGREVTGFDTGKEQLAVAAAKGRLPVVEADVGVVDLQGYDTALCVGTLEYVDDPVSLLRKLRGEVKELILGVLTKPSAYRDSFIRHEFTQRELLRLLHASGWNIVEAEAAHNGDFMLVHAEAA